MNRRTEYISWYAPFEKVLSGGLDKLDVHWFQGGKLNASYNCLDRHLATRGEQPAIIWESDDGNESKIITYSELHASVCRLANVLRQYGVKKGDRICIYLPMIPEAAIAMLEMNGEFYPAAAEIDLFIAERYRTLGDRDKALQRYRAALAKAPQNEMAKQRLAELEKEPPK